MFGIFHFNVYNQTTVYEEIMSVMRIQKHYA